MKEDLKAIYSNEINKHRISLEEYTKKANRWSIIRLITFLLFGAVIILSFQFHLAAGIASIYLGIILFVKIVKKHNEISDERDIYRSLVLINKKEIQYIDQNETDLDNGQQYVNEKHSFASDLDIFGEKSLFQYIIRANTVYGKDALATALKYPLKPEQIKLNQSAIQELQNNLEWRQRFYAQNLNKEDNNLDREKINEWLLVDNSWVNSKVMIALSFIGPLLMIALFVFLLVKFGLLLALLAFVPGALILKKYQDRIKETQDLVQKNLNYLTQYSPMLALIEGASFNFKALVDIQEKIVNGNTKASKNLKKLDWYLDQLDLKYNNVFGMLFNIVFLWDLHFMRLLYRWKKENGSSLSSWLQVMGEMEFLCSLATLAYNNPTWVFPELDINAKTITAEEIGHPLIDREKRVGNSISLPIEQHIKLITGSNMGGKSTFLRSVGINLTLTYMGSKICGAKLIAPMLSIITSMRTNDALSENTSGFYAELKKLKSIVDAVTKESNEERQYYFLIDEVLKGTNTHDRHEGSKALIKQLLDHKGAGLISTHDLKLAEEAEKYDQKVENKCFEVDVCGDELIFDYKIKNGISKSFNATQLMRNMGIDI